MTERSHQMERFRDAVERRRDAAQAGSEAGGMRPPGAEGVSPDGQNLTGADQEQDTLSVRAKNAGKGKKTADKWNQ